MIDAVRQDLRYAARTFRRSPGFVALAILTIAIGVGDELDEFVIDEEKGGVEDVIETESRDEVSEVVNESRIAGRDRWSARRTPNLR